MRLPLRHALPSTALLATALLSAACTTASGAEKPPARRTPAVVPTASPSATDDVEISAPAPRIDPETGEQLAMRASATMTVAAAGKNTAITLGPAPDVDTVIEQSAGETHRVLRLTAADPRTPDDVQFSVDGLATPGTFKTGEGDLRVVFYNAPLGIDLLSDQGDCTVTFTKVDTAGASGSVSCANADSAAGKATLSATFEAKATDAQ